MADIDIALLSQDLSTQISLIINGEVSAEALAEQQFAAIEAINPIINAFISLDESVLDDVGDAMGPFYGIGVPAKDNIAVVDLPLTNGLGFNIEEYPEEDARVISCLKDAGARINGKLNMQAGGLGADGKNPHFGDCINPYQAGFSAGGSSSGSAAAVATCMAVCALGSDTMGSVRIPASYCGIFGFKPSRGAISNSGLIPCNVQYDSIGLLTRSAEDLRLLMDVMAGYDVNDAVSAELCFSQQVNSDAIILVPDDLDALGVSADIISDFQANIETFSTLGYTVKLADFSGLPIKQARRAGLQLCEAEMLATMSDNWRYDKQQYPSELRKLLEYAENKSAVDAAAASLQVAQLEVAVQQLLAQGDFLLLPTTPQRAFQLSQPTPDNQADLTCFANFVGLPAVNIPLKTTQMLPAGMQLVGKLASDYQLIHLAEQWQQASGFEYLLPEPVAKILGLSESK